jgi:gamma-glutamyltranspeptidase/glutathione hydrolase
MRRGFAVVIAALMGAGSPAADRPEGRPFATRSVVFARHGMVAAAHPLAVQIGVDVLKKGGSAVDAAIAVNAALGLMEPMSCGIGGDLFAIVWDARTAHLYGLNASGRAPAGLTADKVPADADGTMPSSTPHTWTVPGAVDGWYELHGKFGRLPMADLLAPAIAAARDGVPAPQVIAAMWGGGERLHRAQPGFAPIYLPGGHAPREGEVFRNPALADSYEAIARGGRDAFYRGSIARDIVAFSKDNGGFFSEDDFARHRSDWVDPVSTDYRGVQVFELPPNTQGIAALQMLNILEGFDLKALGRDSPQFWHTMVEAKKLAYEDRARYIADPAFAKVPVEGLLAKDYARGRARLIDPGRAAARYEAGQPALNRGDTTYLAVADGDGNMVSLIQSNYAAFGSGIVAPGTGFVLHNRGGLFTLDPASPNAPAGRKRPLHTIIPAFAQKGDTRMAFGIMGGWNQAQAHAQFIADIADFKMNIQAALDAPRFSKYTFTGCDLFMENRFSQNARNELAVAGHKIELKGTFSSVVGGGQAVQRDFATGVNYGASDPRKDGEAIPELPE